MEDGCMPKERQRVPIPIEQLIEKYESGSAVTDIAALYGVSPQSVTQRLRGAGIVAMKGFDGVLIGELIEAYESGLSLREIAKQYRVTRQNVKQRLEVAGIEIQPER
jgi:uncharacterized protein (DUF433 family)